MPTSDKRSSRERAEAALREQQAAERRRSMTVVGAVLAVLVIIGGAVYFGLSRGDKSGEKATEAGTPANVTDYTITVGEADAPKTLTFYEDPQCPVCAEFEASVKDQVHAAIEAGEVKVEYRIVSFLDKASSNEYSSRAANALFAVASTAGPDIFAAYHDLLYADQPAEGGDGHSDDQLIEYAVQAGADDAKVRPLIEDKTYEQFVVNATDEMSKNDVSGTPTVFIDGEKVEGTPIDSMNAVLEATE